MTRIPLQVTFRGVERTDLVESDIRERLAWLEQFYDRVIGCRVLVEVPHRHRRDGRHVRVRIALTVPGGAPIVVSHEPSLHGAMADTQAPAHRKDSDIDGAHQYARVAVREAFDAARRQLQDFAREQRGDIKTHELAP